MRLAAQMRGGFYPTPPEAVSFATAFLCPPIGSEFSILDSCAGCTVSVGARRSNRRSVAGAARARRSGGCPEAGEEVVR
jgi:hypothetical protein